MQQLSISVVVHSRIPSIINVMNIEELIATAKALMMPDKGLLAMDESLPTCNKRFEEVGIPQRTEEYRHKYRQLNSNYTKIW